jgi:hypothetical protein
MSCLLKQVFKQNEADDSSQYILLNFKALQQMTQVSMCGKEQNSIRHLQIKFFKLQNEQYVLLTIVSFSGTPTEEMPP